MPWNEEDYATVPDKYRAKLASAARGVIADTQSENLLTLTIALSQVLQSVIGPIATVLGKGPDWINGHPIALVYVCRMIEVMVPPGTAAAFTKSTEAMSRMVHEWAQQ